MERERWCVCVCSSPRSVSLCIHSHTDTRRWCAWRDTDHRSDMASSHTHSAAPHSAYPQTPAGTGTHSHDAHPTHTHTHEWRLRNSCRLGKCTFHTLNAVCCFFVGSLIYWNPDCAVKVWENVCLYSLYMCRRSDTGHNTCEYLQLDKNIQNLTIFFLGALISSKEKVWAQFAHVPNVINWQWRVWCLHKSSDTFFFR